MGVFGRAFYAVGLLVRETGQALDRLGSRLQGNYSFREQLSRHRPLMNMSVKVPIVDKSVFVAPSAAIIGDVCVGSRSSIWYGCVVRGDVNGIRIGSGTNIQDNSLVLVGKSNLKGQVFPTIIGDKVNIGHSSVLRGCTIEDEAFIGLGATLLEGVYVEKHAMVATRAVVMPNTRIPTGQVWSGNPARYLRRLTEQEMCFFSLTASNCFNLAKIHADENAQKLDDSEFEKVLCKNTRHEKDCDSVLGIGRKTLSYDAFQSKASTFRGF